LQNENTKTENPIAEDYNSEHEKIEFIGTYND
jgi:hypothetical protein